MGAGSAGCVLANRLSENSSVRVLLLEAGGPDTSPWIHIPVGYFKTLHNPKTDWCYKTEPEAELQGRSLDWPRGKGLGGSSSINGLLYVRGQAEDYNNWAQAGNTGWAYDDVLPLFKRSESYELGENAFHGGSGGLSVSKNRAKSQISEAFIEAAVQMGVPRNDDYNGPTQEGVAYFDQTAKNGLRCSSAKAFLRPARYRANLKILTHAQTNKLLFAADNEKQVTGVAFTKDGQNQHVMLRGGGEVILSAGTICSPQILELSGIGQPEVLNKAGIQLRSELPGVGEALQDHLQIRLVFETNVPTLNDIINSPAGKMKIGLHYLLKRGGPMSLGASQVAIFAKSMAGLDTPDIQFHFQPLSADKPGLVMHSFSGFTSSVCQLRPESRGYIHITSPDPNAYPRIVPNYLSATADQLCAVRAVRFARAMAETKALKPFVVREHTIVNDMSSDEDHLEVARRFAQTIYHPTSTCRMGRDDKAVVDPRLQVYGIQNLRIADASVMPSIVSGNTNAPAIMIGEKAADLILADRLNRQIV